MDIQIRRNVLVKIKGQNDKHKHIVTFKIYITKDYKLIKFISSFYLLIYFVRIVSWDTRTFWYHKTNKAVTSKEKSAQRRNLALQEYSTFLIIEIKIETFILPHLKKTISHGMDSLQNEEIFVLGFNDFFDPLRKRSRVHQAKYLEICCWHI